MKRIMKIVVIALFICSLPLAVINAQGNKNEQHIKIVVADKSGTKTELDTIINNASIPDSIKMKDGKVIYISKHGAMAGVKCHTEGNGDHMIVTLSSDDDMEKEIEKEITIIACDSAEMLKNCDEKGIFIVKAGKHSIEGKRGDVMVWSSDETGSKGRNIIRINENKEEMKDGEKTFNIEVKTDDSGNAVEKTKYVLAKDGMVISIEGNDEAKVTDLVKDIESKLGVTRTEASHKQVVKEETKKTVKK
jgi:hypothetical protein